MSKEILDRPKGHEGQGSLSVYGIGLKRAIFKLGGKISVESRTRDDGFRVRIDADEWLGDDDADNPDWSFPLEDLSPARSAGRAGTKTSVRRLHDEVKMRLSDGTFMKRLRHRIAVTYSLFLNRYVTIFLNDTQVQPEPIPLGRSEAITPAVETSTIDRVNIQIVAGLSARPWSTEKAGWYVLCNGRVVVEADKSDLTGWTIKMAGFQPKYRGFLGVVFFFSDHPEDLPWTTTKRGLNRESEVYQVALSRMSLVARPVMSFLDRMYVQSEVESAYERELAADVQQAKLSEIPKQTTVFSTPPAPRRREKTVSVQYKVERQKLELVRRTLKKPTWSAGQIGRYALDYFIEQECEE